ncbi:hypothetical protein F503_07751 [Ophiostoma piceae UAMH 11346]|uniref:Uncharacterized protein n=1 Tax=Ophiostoma piceae (strain UAMH 11346) TaxID=1262450 RepID=S3D1G1_OPHP1|nr:hypothetical protein F503_07751 [Ophiostoma piceae UAMH 11346]
MKRQRDADSSASDRHDFAGPLGTSECDPWATAARRPCDPCVSYANPLYFHIVGGPKAFVLKPPGENYIVKRAGKFAKLIYVGTLTTKLSASELEGLMIDNESYEYNCHSWVEKALQLLKDYGYIAEAEYEAGFDSMMGATVEAVDG